MARVVRVSDLRNAYLPPVVVWPPVHESFDETEPVFVLGQVCGVLNMERGGLLNPSKALKQLREITAGFEKGLHEK